MVQFCIFNTFAKISKPVFALSLCGFVCRLRNKNDLINFRIRLYRKKYFSEYFPKALSTYVCHFSAVGKKMTSYWKMLVGQGCVCLFTWKSVIYVYCRFEAIQM